MSDKGPTSFPSAEDLLKWSGHEEITFPYPGGKGWIVKITKDAVPITSQFYEVRGDPKGYGAPKIFGHLLPLGDKEISGLIEVGPKGEIKNRRRATPGDKLTENQKIIGVIITQPDRVIEPVAVIISESLENYSKDPAVWMSAILNARDSLELAAQQAVLKEIEKMPK